MTSAGNKSSSAGEAAKAIGRPFKPGVSGNPSGRPKVVEEFRHFIDSVNPDDFAS